MKLAVVQTNVTFADPAANLQRMQAQLRETAQAGAELTLFPECVLTGYGFHSLEEARPFAESIPGPATTAITATCRELNVNCVFGLLESDGERMFNAAVTVGPEGVIASYRKVHLPHLGIDQYVNYGDRPFAIHTVRGVNIGVLICYDVGFPEAVRSLALLGADLILLPTNWPPGAECQAEHIIPSRAMENHLYVAAANRVGEERGFRYIGNSSICAPGGARIAKAPASDEAVLYAEIDVAIARKKRIVRVPGKHSIDRIADRRPELYGQLVLPHAMRTPRQDAVG